MKRNPFAPKVPCHRVIASTLDLGGFKGTKEIGSANLRLKRKMLEDEGVVFAGDDRVSVECVFENFAKN
jgi:methylated-DNA-[protein]-cysteine S-methyltransferase